MAQGEEFLGDNRFCSRSTVVKIVTLSYEGDRSAAAAATVADLLFGASTDRLVWQRVTLAELELRFSSGSVLLLGGPESVPLLPELAKARLPAPSRVYVFGRGALEYATGSGGVEWTGGRLKAADHFSITTMLQLCAGTQEIRTTTMQILSDGHEAKMQLIQLLDTSPRPFEAVRTALESFLAKYEGHFLETDLIGAFYRKFFGCLDHAGRESLAAGFDAAATRRTIRGFCLAMGSLSSMKEALAAGDSAPVSDPSAPTRRSRRSTAADGDAANRRLIPVTVLIIDDDDIQAASVRRHLERCSVNLERFQLRVLEHVPLRDGAGRPTETAVEYRNRLLDRIRCRTEERELTTLFAVVYDYALEDLRESADGQTLSGIELARTVARVRPGMSSYLLTGKDILEVVEQSEHAFVRVFSKSDGIELDELYRTLVESLEDRYATPFWASLLSFTRRPVVTMHAMAISHARSLKRSAVLEDVLSFYSDNYFLAETSATIDPLDSLLHPGGSIRRAQEKAARAFGSRRTLFVTNGTTSANKIVLTAVLGPGEVVLVDRNCHISHHHGIAALGARPVYLEPTHADEYGISGGIPLERIEAALDEQLSVAWTHPDEFPRAILLTNCTFDGVICSPEQVIRRSFSAFERAGFADRFRELVFLFDEAWFAYARFHPLFAERTAMATAARLAESDAFFRANLRVYSTQSTHKTLSAFRQASMLHAWDPVLESDELLQDRLSQALQMHTTTSPHSGLIASLDFARRQVELEGCALVDSAVTLANRFRADFQRMKGAQDGRLVDGWRAVVDEFTILEESHLIRGGEDGEFQLDPTKITLHSRSYTGTELKRVLLDKFDIQVNKTTNNTVLMMANAGTTLTTAAIVKNSLYALAATASRKPRTGEQPPIPKFSRFWTDPMQPAWGDRRDIGAFMRNNMRYPIKACALREAEGRVSSGFVVPYPPGYPVLVPGQVIEADAIAFLRHLKTKEIHGVPVGRGEEQRVWVFDVDGRETATTA